LVNIFILELLTRVFLCRIVLAEVSWISSGFL
jgi:hypothetical protein